MVTAAVQGFNAWDVVVAPYVYLKSAVNFTRIVCVEGYSVFRHTLPDYIRWHFHTLILRDYVAYRLEVGEGLERRVAILYQIGKIPSEGTGKATLVCHGDHGHPGYVMPLIDIAKRMCRLDLPRLSGPVFALWMPHETDYTPAQKKLFSLATAQMKTIVRQNGASWKGILGIGHSKGAIHLAYEAFTPWFWSDIKAVIGVAGRYRIRPNITDRQCTPLAMHTVQQIYGAITSPFFRGRFCQIAASDDWCTRGDCSIVTKKNWKVINGAMHANIVYQCGSTVEKYMKKWL